MKPSPRVTTALIAAPIVAAIIYFGGWLFWLVCALLAFLGLSELQSAMRRSTATAGARLVAPFAYPALVLLMLVGVAPSLTSALPILLLALAVLIFGTRNRVSLPSIALTLLALLYVGLFAFLPLLRNRPDGSVWFWLTILGVWAGDIAAYYAGRAVGKTKLSQLSPGKTWEGVIAGAIATLIVVTGTALGTRIPLFHGLVAGILISVVAPLGDLAESYWKRELGVKDLGSLLPGHGGVLDRCDSLLFAVWAVYWWVERVG